MLKNLLLLSAFSTFVVIVIIALNLFHSYTLSNLSPRTQNRIIPITPTFDKKTLEELKQRKEIDVNLLDRSHVVSEDKQEVGTQEDSKSASQSGTSL